MNLQKRRELEQILKQKIVEIENLPGGSGDSISLLTLDNKTKYIFKTGSKDSIDSQIKFYKQYSDLPYLPKLANYDPNYSELLITYISPEKSEDYDKISIITYLVEDFLSFYKIADANKFGFLSTFLNGDSFADFLINQTNEAYFYIQDIFSREELRKIINLIREVYDDPVFNQKYLLHGDLGFHNLFYSENKLIGIIDPDPIIGHPIYDLMFAYSSSPRQITPESLEECLSLLNNYFPIKLEKNYEYLTIALFKRISSCKKHHPDDLTDYLSLWKKMSIFNK